MTIDVIDLGKIKKEYRGTDHDYDYNNPTNERLRFDGLKCI